MPLLVALALGSVSMSAHAQSEAELQDMISVLVNDTLLRVGADHCEENEASRAADLRTGLASWRARNAVDEVRRRLEAARPAALAQVDASADRVEEAMGGVASVEALCNELLASLSVDLRARYPGAYASGTPSPATTAPAPAPTAAPPPQGTVMTVAQLAATFERVWGKPDKYAAMRAEGLSGRIYLRGTVERVDTSTFLVTRADGFRSKMVVSAGINLTPYVGREVVVSGVIDELPATVVFLTDASLVTDPSALVPATEPEAPGLSRTSVDASAIRASAGEGIPASAIQAVFYWNQLLGSEYREESYLLLRDGTFYRDPELAPSDIDAGRSRQVQPQRWGRWEAAGNHLRLRAQDDQGRLGEWTERTGTTYGGWPAGTRVHGTFTSKRFVGSQWTGGTYRSDALTLSSDGRFAWRRLVESSSGEAALGNGYAGSAATVSDGEGTRTTSYGGNASVGASAAQATDDGADLRGQYRFDGYALTLTYDSGKIERRFSYRIDDLAIVVDGTRYSR